MLVSTAHYHKADRESVSIARPLRALRIMWKQGALNGRAVNMDFPSVSRQVLVSAVHYHKTDRKLISVACPLRALRIMWKQEALNGRAVSMNLFPALFSLFNRHRGRATMLELSTSGKTRGRKV